MKEKLSPDLCAACQNLSKLVNSVETQTLHQQMKFLQEKSPETEES